MLHFLEGCLVLKGIRSLVCVKKRENVSLPCPLDLLAVQSRSLITRPTPDSYTEGDRS